MFYVAAHPVVFLFGHGFASGFHRFDSGVVVGYGSAACRQEFRQFFARGERIYRVRVPSKISQIHRKRAV